MHGCFSFCFYLCSCVIFSWTELKFLLEDKFSPVFKHSFFWSEENVIPNNFQHLMVYECWCVLYIFWNSAVFPYILWQMLLSYVLNASGVPWQMLLSYIYCGRCYCHVICGRMVWPQRQMVLPLVKQGGTCYCQLTLLCMADGKPLCFHVAIDIWQMEFPRWQMQ